MSDGGCETDDEELAKRRVPCLATFVHPFRIVDGPNSQAWSVSIDQINSGTWDYVALHEIVGGIDVGLEHPYHMVVCRDGGLALPPLPELRDEQAAVQFFNQSLAAILLGGVYCEAITLDGLNFGSIIDWKYVRIQRSGNSTANRLQHLFRLKRASSYEAIQLETPRTLKVEDLVKASDIGRGILNQVPVVGGEFLLRGATAYARRDWGTALANLWIVIEQITSQLWEQNIVIAAKYQPVIQGRIDSLEDNRTWTVGVKHEVLFQKGILPASAFASLNMARKARNKLSHSGKHPDQSAAASALQSVKELLMAIVSEDEIPFLNLDLDDHGLSDPFQVKETTVTDAKYWMEIYKLPGEAELERLEAKARSKSGSDSD